MATIEDPKQDVVPPPGPLRKMGRLLSWGAGVLFALMGLVLLTQKSSMPMGLGMLLGGALILPPISDQIRQRTGLLRPTWAPPVLTFAIVFGAIVVNSMTATPGQVQAERKAIADREAAGAAKDKARAEAETQKKAGKYLARLNEALGKVEAVAAGKTDDMDKVTATASLFDDSAKLLDDGKDYAADPAVQAAMLKLRAALAAKQQTALPLLRASYAAILDGRLWEDNVDVTAQGKGNRNIRFVGVWFAANRNVAKVQGEVHDMLRKLRFSQSRYEWYRGSEYNYYDIKTPADSEIGFWDYADFKPVAAPGAAAPAKAPAKP